MLAAYCLSLPVPLALPCTQRHFACQCTSFQARDHPTPQPIYGAATPIRAEAGAPGGMLSLVLAQPAPPCT